LTLLENSATANNTVDRSNRLLSISNLTIGYQSKRGNLRAVDDANLVIEKNKFIAVVGESGCGKSTLALAIIGLLSSPPAKIQSGKIEYKSVNLLALNENDRRKYRGTEIAMIFQEPLTSLNPVYKVGDQIAEAIMVREERKGGFESESDVMQKVYNVKNPQIPSRWRLPRRSLAKYFRSEILDALKLVRIPDPEQVMERYPFELSGGMVQRVMIAMALAQKPALLIADEPTTALDVTTQAQVLKLMKILMDEVNTSVLLITHDLAVASQVADRIIVMYAGDIVEDADVYDFFSEPLHPYSKGLLSCVPSGSKEKARLNPIPGTVPDLMNVPEGCKYASRCPYVMSMCRSRKPPLAETKKPKHKVACFLYGV
jgi:oligopeptide/dipeptide ABC transporter ATP-binding protein